MSRHFSVDDPGFWDRWREEYYSITPEENLQLCNDIESRYPNQTSFSPDLFVEFLSGFEAPVKVMEIGGWKGELAHQCMDRLPGKVSTWDNVDMCAAAVGKSILIEGHPYRPTLVPFDWFSLSPQSWHPDGGDASRYDVLISAHSLEHLSDLHCLRVLEHVTVDLDIPHILLEIPITESGHRWPGYIGTHILGIGWSHINDEMKRRGYRIRQLTEIAFRYDR